MLKPLSVTLAMMSGTVMVLASPALASPQLRHQTVSVSGNAQNCLARAQAALTRAGFATPATTADTVSASSGQLTATIYCQQSRSNPVQAVVMLAGDATVAPATVASTLNNLITGLNQAAPSQSSLPRSASRITGTALSDTAFDQLMGTLRSSWPNYLDFLAQPVSQNYFTAAQASRIVDTMRFPNEEIEAAVMLYPRVVDPGNWFLVEQAITFTRTRQELRQRLMP